MNPKEIENFIIKFLNTSTTQDELVVLNEWIKDPNNQLVFKDYVKTHYAITFSMNETNPDEIRDRLLKEIRKDKNVFYNARFRNIMKYTAMFLVLIGISYTYQKLSNKAEIITPNEEVITLLLENGDTKIISENGNEKVVDAKGNVVGKQDGSKLVYNKNSSVKKLIYNTLSVPYGKRFDITLSDGTHVFLNAGSSIKYPVKFLNGKNREVFLTGEAFFDVTKDELNPFIVNSQEVKVKVLGTKFNLASYPEDNNTDVVLVEGSVSMNSKEEKFKTKEDIILKSGFKGAFNKTNKTISVKKIDTDLYTSWINGNIVFRNAPFDNIIKKLERHYNVIIINNNKKLINETFNATVEVDKETIEDVMYYFNKIYHINYETVNNKIVINP